MYKIKIKESEKYNDVFYTQELPKAEVGFSAVYFTFHTVESMSVDDMEYHANFIIDEMTRYGFTPRIGWESVLRSCAYVLSDNEYVNVNIM